MRRWLRRWLNQRKPYVCKVCGYRVPLIGTRWEQAGRALDHWEANHDHPRRQPYPCE